MATKRKAKRPSRRRSKKKKGSLITPARVALLVIFLGLSAAIGYIIMERDQFLVRGVHADWVDSVLIAARLDLDTDKRVVTRDGVERWLITLPDRETKNRVVAALEQGLKANSTPWDIGEETWRNDSYVQLVALRKSDGSDLRLILMVPGKRGRTETPQARVEPVHPIDVPPPVPEPASEPVADDRPRVAIILDDVGLHPTTKLDPVLELSFPITFAVLPYLPHTRDNAIHFHQNRYEVMLHMPMEPTNYPKANPGEGAILRNMSEAEITDAVSRAISDIPFVSGVNNHMGSRITANRTMMLPILREVRVRGLYFVDSRTSPRTVAYNLSRELDLRSAKRDVFIDPEPSYEVAKRQIDEIRKVARAQGYAIAIGHPYPTTLRALAEEMPLMDREGFDFVFASSLVRKGDGQP